MGTRVEFATSPEHIRGMDDSDSGMARAPLSQDNENGSGQLSARGRKLATITPSHRFARLRGMFLALGLLIATTCFPPVPASAQAPSAEDASGPTLSIYNSGNDAPTHNNVARPMSAKQKQSILQLNFQKSKSDAVALAALAKELREELDKPTANGASVEVTSRAERIEKLAKKIREEMKGF